MAISLKNVDDRLKILESAGVNCEITNIFFDTSAPIVGTKSFSVDLTQYDFLLVSGAGGGHKTTLVNTPCQTIMIPTASLIRGDKIIQGDWYASNLFDNFYLSYANQTLSFNKGGNATPDGQLYFIIGVKLVLKLYYNFSYNIIYKIYTLYKFHKIAISLSHFLNFITGGETWKWL